MDEKRISEERNYRTRNGRTGSVIGNKIGKTLYR